MMVHAWLLAVIFVARSNVIVSSEPDFSEHHRQCHALLEKMRSSNHGDFELHAACRARFPPPLCQDALETLGEQPWAPEKIDRACYGLGDLIHARSSMMSPERKAVTYKDLQSTLDLCVETKAGYTGHKVPKDANGHVDLDKALELKLVETKKVTMRFNVFWNKYFHGGVSPEVANTFLPEGKWSASLTPEYERSGDGTAWAWSMVASVVAGAVITLIVQRVLISTVGRNKTQYVMSMRVNDNENRALRCASAESETELQ